MSAIAFSTVGGGGTMPTEPRYVEESPRATLDEVDASLQLADDGPRGLRVAREADADGDPRAAVSRTAWRTARRRAAGSAQASVAAIQLRGEELGQRDSRGPRRSRPRPGPLPKQAPAAARVAGDDRLDLLLAKGTRLDLEALARDRRGRDRRRARRARDLFPPPVEELDEEPCLVRAHGVHETLVGRTDLVPVAREGVRSKKPERVDGGRLENDEPRAAMRPAPRGRRRSRPWAGARGRGSSDARSRRCGSPARLGRS